MSGCGCAGSCDCGKSPRAAVLPGDPALFRYDAVLERMLDRISRAEALGGRPLGGLGRSLDDPAVALLAAAAGAHHVLGWTMHRLALDSTLPDTEDRAALVRLGGMLGYAPRPAIAAQTLFALRVGTLPGGADVTGQPGLPTVVTIPPGLSVATIPEQDEQMVVFETDAALEAHAAWNALLPLRPLVLPTVAGSTTILEVEGVRLGARVGDRVLVRIDASATAESAWLLARVTEVEVVAAADPPRTVLTVAGGSVVKAADTVTSPAAPGTVILLAGRAQAFGATAPDCTFMPKAVQDAYGEPPAMGIVHWQNFVLGSPSGGDWSIHLGAIHPEAAQGRVVALESATGTPAPGLARISAARETARSAFGLSARCTLITIGSALAADYNSRVRETTVHIETGRGTLLATPADPDQPAKSLPDRLDLAGEVALPPGRRVVLTGRTLDGGPLSEAATVLSCESRTAGATLLVFDAPLTGRWHASTLTVLGNVVAASDARSSPSGTETLGSGDPAIALPRFPLVRSPLAHLAAPGPVGYGPAIEVRVADRRYEVARSLYGEGVDSRRFRVSMRPDGTAEVQFAGRLASGAGNVVARYRSGGGTTGNLPAGRLTQVLTPIVGLGAVTNPLPGEGGSDAETLAEMRAAAPRAIRTLDRAVTLADFESFAQEYRGVGRATAVEMRAGLRRLICVTVATTTFEPPGAGSPIVSGLHDALVAAAPPGTHVRIEGFVDLPMQLTLALAVADDLPRVKVEADVRAALVAALGRRVRPFGTAVHRSQVLAAAQNVPGVLGAVLIRFTAGDPPDLVVEDAEGRLPCPGPVLVMDRGIARLETARLLSIAAHRVTFTELTS